MKNNNTINLAFLIDLRNIKVVFCTIRDLFLYHYPKNDFKEIEKCYKKVKALFEGNYKGYNACNTPYHDLYHTMDVFLAAARLLDGYNLREEKLPVRLAQNLLKASLFHDTGYIQEKWDNEGTGGKYTLNHIGRSIAFIVKNKNDFAIGKEDVDAVSKMIRCTEIKNNLSTIPFVSGEESTAGMILGSADILGQMSDREYLERLLFLYFEMKEAGIPDYKTEYDIIKNTLDFYEIVKKRLNNSFKKIHEYAKEHFKKRFDIDRNLYIEAIEKNVAYVEKIINDSSTNFRHKLKRGKIIEKSDLVLAQENQ